MCNFSFPEIFDFPARCASRKKVPLILVDAFMFDRKNRLKFTPQDKLMDVYRLMYPPGNFCDAMELETFADTLDRQYEVDLATLDSWEHITLGQLFEMTRNKKLHAIVK